MIKIIINKNAGRGYCLKNLPKLLTFFNDNFENYDISYTLRPLHATELTKEAIKNGVTEIIGVGGDGTALEILAGLENERNILFSIFPGGTGNDLVKSLGFSVDMDTFLEEYLKRNTAMIDIALTNYGPYFSICGLGFVTDVLVHVNENEDSFIKGSFAFAYAVFQSIKNIASSKLEIIVDGKKIERDVMLAAVINSPYSGGGMKLAPSARPNDSKLHLFLVKEISKMELIKVFPRIYNGSHVNHEAVEIITGKEITINSEHEMLTNFDGNVFGHTPLHIKISEKSQEVIVGPLFKEE